MKPSTHNEASSGSEGEQTKCDFDRLPRGMSIAQACHQLGIGRTTIYSRLIATGALCPVRFGSRTIIPSNQVDALLVRSTEAGATPIRGTKL